MLGPRQVIAIDNPHVVASQGARQDGDNYFVPSATLEEARQIEHPLDFLPEGRFYTVLVCRDASDAHCLTNREAYTTRTEQADSATTIQAQLAPGGGHCLLISPVD
jgi:alpha-glucosidase